MRERIEWLRSSIRRRTADALGPARNVALLNYPDYWNVGDSALWLGAMRVLDELGVNVAYHATHLDLDLDVLHSMSDLDAILFTGGGNFGDLWPGAHLPRERVLGEFRDVPIVQLPQSLHFDEPENLERTARLARGVENLTLMWRDRPSYADAQKTIAARHILCPDTAFMLGPLPQTRPKVDVVWLARADKEAISSPFSLQLPHSVLVADWDSPMFPQPELEDLRRRARELLAETKVDHESIESVYRCMAELRVHRGLRILSYGGFVITDRLHAHILVSLQGRPHALLDNSYGKLSASWRYVTRPWGLAQVAGSAEEALGIARMWHRN
jgi:exopolysaccharide biosynthesis predicted pyruvyltransferase EpsI